MKSVRHLCVIAVCCLATLQNVRAADADSNGDDRPNILIVLADDLGYGDLGCYGHPRIKTPTIDRFAAEGLKLTSCYSSAPNCSPSRAGLMTGRTPFRVGIYNWIPVFSPMHVRRSEITIATLLRNSGYDTCHTGKWHLNGDLLNGRTPFEPPAEEAARTAGGPPWKPANLAHQPQPWDHGFSHWFSTQNNALPNHRNPHNFVRNGSPVGPLKGYSAELVADEATDWLENKRDYSKPFFLFACFHEPHEPIASAKRFTELYPSDDPSLSAHHGNVSQLDEGLRRLLLTLERLELRKNTFIFFTSDNGPAITSIHPHGSSGSLRDKKGYLYEGGIRVPGIIQWPGRTRPGTVSDEPVSGVDVLPTLCELANVAAPTDRALDGASFLPVLSDKPIERSSPLYWQFNRSTGVPQVCVRDGDWKLLAHLTTPKPRPSGEITAEEIADIKIAELTGFELYNLKSDIAESKNVKGEYSDRFAALQKSMQAIYHDVRDEAPHWPAWHWPRYESKLIGWPEYRLKRRRSR